MNVKGTKKKNQVATANIFEQQELLKKAEVIKKNLTASTWRELETNGKFGKNDKLSFITDEMFRLVGFGDNAGSGFPTILDVWKSEGWIKPELTEDTNLDQVTLVMTMEKESDDKSAEKSAESAEKSADFSHYGGWY